MTAIDEMHEKDPDWLKNPMGPAFAEVGITPTKLARKINREFNANETKVIKIKGAVRQEDLPKPFSIVATSGILEYDDDGNSVYGTGETLIRYKVQALGIRQKARQDAHKLMGDYPAEKHEVEVTERKLVKI